MDWMGVCPLLHVGKPRPQNGSVERRSLAAQRRSMAPRGDRRGDGSSRSCDYSWLDNRLSTAEPDVKAALLNTPLTLGRLHRL